MDASTAAPLQGQVLLSNQLKLLTSTTVAGALYGLAFTLFCLYVHSVILQLEDEDRRRQAKFMLGYSIVIMLCGMYILVVNAWVAQDAYIKHSNYPGGPYIYIGTTFHTNRAVTGGFICQTLLNAMTSAIQIWRVWVIWSTTGYNYFVTVLPILCFLTFTALEIRTVILETILPIDEVIHLNEKLDIVPSIIQGVTTILCTMLISAYLIYKQWQQRKLIGKDQGSTGYLNIVAMLIESYALESIWLLAVALTENQGVSAFFIESVAYIQIIAYLLVLYRVASGKAYKSQRGEKNISSLRWEHSNYATTVQFGETRELHGGPHMSVIPEVLDTIPRFSSTA